MNILISTGIYPPKIGGPAQYAKNIAQEFSIIGHNVDIATFGMEEFVPTGFRHIIFFLKVLPKVLRADCVFILDTFSVGAPTILACKLLNKKSIIRTGGDFLWEQYVERTGKKILLRNFYIEEILNLSFKEKLVYKITRWTLKNSSRVVFSTEWHRDIFIKAYDLDSNKVSIVENYYGKKDSDVTPVSKVFVASTRNLRWKNLNTLHKVFGKIRENYPYVELFTDNLPYERFMEKIKNSYAVIQVSLGDISPNMIMDAIRYNKPFICTEEVGIYNRIKDIGIFVNPLDEEKIREQVVRLLDPVEYESELVKIKSFSFTHFWREIASELLAVSNKI